jgi:hypothetical protein
MGNNWANVKAKAEKVKRISDFCERSGQSVSFHIDLAIDNYLTDVLPVWESKMEAVRKSLPKK